MSENGWGGRRPGAGRPKGTTKPVHIQRKQRQVRAFDDEWEVIKDFMNEVRAHGAEWGRGALMQMKQGA